MSNKNLLLISLPIAALLSACGQTGFVKKNNEEATDSAGSVLNLPENVPYRSVAPLQISSHDILGFYVRWGGRIDEFRFLKDSNTSCLRITAHPDPAAGIAAVPDSRQARNDFWACMPAKYDKNDLKIGNYVRLIGKVIGFMHNRPLVRAEKLLIMDRGSPAHNDGGLIFRSPRRLQ